MSSSTIPEYSLLPEQQGVRGGGGVQGGCKGPLLAHHNHALAHQHLAPININPILGSSTFQQNPNTQPVNPLLAILNRIQYNLAHHNNALAHQRLTHAHFKHGCTFYPHFLEFSS